MSDIHALSGAYAIDALDDIERAQFERHLAECAECRAEVDSLREASAHARRDHRRRAPRRPARPAARRDQDRAAAAAGRPGPGGDSRGRRSPSPPPRGNVTPLRPGRRLLRGLVAAAAVVAAIGAGAVVWQPWTTTPARRPS